jgi:hypothetical protein
VAGRLIKSGNRIGKDRSDAGSPIIVNQTIIKWNIIRRETVRWGLVK